MMTKAKSKPKAEPEEEVFTHIWLSGKHSRRLPDGNSERFYPGDGINPTPQEQSAFPDKMATMEEFRAIASTHAAAREAEVKQRAAAKAAKAKNSPIIEKKRDPEAIKRGELLKKIRDDNRKKNIRM